ncbi:hypothetical protein KBC04_00615 [Candidatus Babeliales bacterium]|nr:hypothetical protein [Candidatus Babeliales bacterium]MBP9843406.1 hypothetical protein [Candidatus Babeliales bacterium]
MKRILLLFCCMFGSVFFAKDHAEKQIEKLVTPYEPAIEFILSLDPSRKVNDHDIFLFFNKYGLFQKKDIKKFKSSLSIVKRLTYKKKTLLKYRHHLENLIDNLEKVQNFITAHSTTYYALLTYYEISAFYYYIDEQHADVVGLMTSQSNKLGLPTMQGRGLYKFVKKIDLDLRRLTALFVQNNLSDDFIVKINNLKTKLVTLKNKIIITSVYKSQLRKTRLLKACGVITLISFTVAYAAYFAVSLSSVPLWAVIFNPVYVWIVVPLCITVQELQESSKYNIPVHSNSLFSWFRPFFLLTWIPRG